MTVTALLSAASHRNAEPDNSRGSVLFATSGSFKWKCPAGVTSINAAVVAAGTMGTYNTSTKVVTGGDGGNLRYKNNIPVVPGQEYDIIVGQTQWGQSPYKELSKSSAFGIVAFAVGIGGDTALGGGVGGGPGANGNNTSALNTIPGHGEPGRWDGQAAARVIATIALTKGVEVDGTYSAAGRFGKSGYYLKTSDAGQGTFDPNYPPAGGAVRIVWGIGRAFPSTDVAL